MVRDLGVWRDGHPVLVLGSADVLRGGKGDDLLRGGDGDDIYVFAFGDGDDTIAEGAGQDNADRLLFERVFLEDVTLVRSGDDIAFVLADGGGSVRVDDGVHASLSRGVELVEFAGGTVLDKDAIRMELIVRAISPGDDVVTGFGTDDVLWGGAGDDLLSGSGGNDVYL
mgnify:CR=1 FL=1